MGLKRCINCMEEFEESARNCPHCGYVQDMETQSPVGIKPGTILRGRYLVGRILGQGGFGITYVGYDFTLDIKVAIKEYFPMGLATRNFTVSNQIQWNTSHSAVEQGKQGSESFLKEARRMAKLDSLTGIVRVRDTFPENQTSYIVMDFVDGETLKQRLIKTGVMGIHDCLALLSPLMQSLGKMHQKGLVHRDISPDNIMIKPDGSACLLDFGAAKDVSMQQNASSQQIAKDGFSPPEQYRDKGSIGPWTDVYALCATIYYCITGKMIPKAMDRIYEDTLTFDTATREPLSEAEKSALKDGLTLRSEDRIQSIEELLSRLSGTAATDSAPAARETGETAPSTQQEPIAPVSPPPEEAKANAASQAVYQPPVNETAVKPADGMLNNSRPEVKRVEPEKEGQKKQKAKKKMSWKKKTVIIIAALLIFFYIIGSCSSSDTKQYYFENYRYEINSDGNITLRDYDGNDEVIEIPSEIKGKSVTIIGNNTFKECTNLHKVTIPGSVTEINTNAFQNCISLAEIMIPAGVTNIGRNAFDGCRSITEITIPDGVTQIRESLFKDCSSLTQITISDNVTEIGGHAFRDCISLAEIMIPDSVSKIEEKTFVGCTSLSLVSLPEGCEVADDAFDSDFKGEIVYRDASGYVRALLDVACKNDSTYFVAQNIGTAEEAASIYQEIMSGAMTGDVLDGIEGLTEEQTERMKGALYNLFAKADYTVVGKVQEQDDGTYFVPVSYRQLKVFGAYLEKLEQDAYALGEKYASGAVSEEDLNTYLLDLLVQGLEDAVEQAEYSDKTAEKIVKVRKRENGSFKIDDADIEELMMQFFDYDAAEGE